MKTWGSSIFWIYKQVDYKVCGTHNFEKVSTQTKFQRDICILSGSQLTQHSPRYTSDTPQCKALWFRTVLSKSFFNCYTVLHIVVLRISGISEFILTVILGGPIRSKINFLFKKDSWLNQKKRGHYFQSFT